MTPDLAAGLRALAESLPAGTAIPVPRETLLELLTPAPTDGVLLPVDHKASANGADETLLTVDEVAARFGVTPDWLYRHWKAVGGVKLGRKVLRFPAGALPRYLEARRKTP